MNAVFAVYIAQADGSGGAAAAVLLLWVGASAVGIWGIVRLFTGNHTGLGVVALFVPFVFIAWVRHESTPGQQSVQ